MKRNLIKTFKVAFPYTVPIFTGFLFSRAILGNKLLINTQGLDFVMTALFIVIFLDYLLKNKDYLSSASGFIVSLLSLIIFDKDNFIIPAMIAIVVVLLSLRRKYDAN